MTSFMTKNGYSRASIVVHKRVFDEMLVTRPHLQCRYGEIYMWNVRNRTTSTCANSSRRFITHLITMNPKKWNLYLLTVLVKIHF